MTFILRCAAARRPPKRSRIITERRRFCRLRNMSAAWSTPATPEDSDTFTFTAGAGDTVFISLDLDPERDVTTFNGRIGLGVFGTPGNLLVTGDTGTVDTIDSEAIVMTVETAGTYRFIPTARWRAAAVRPRHTTLT